MEATAQPPTFGQRHPRTLGVLLLLVALVIGKWQIYNPLHGAEYGYTELRIWPKLIGVATILGVYGLTLCMVGDRLSEWMPIDFQNISWQFALAASGLAFVSLGIYIYIMVTLNDQGYVTGYF